MRWSVRCNVVRPKLALVGRTVHRIYFEEFVHCFKIPSGGSLDVGLHGLNPGFISGWDGLASKGRSSGECRGAAVHRAPRCTPIGVLVVLVCRMSISVPPMILQGRGVLSCSWKASALT